MRIQWLWPIVFACLIIGSYELGRRHHTSKPATPLATRNSSLKVPGSNLETKENDEYLGQVKVVGPLANWMRDAEENGAVTVPQEAPSSAYEANNLDRVIRTPPSAPDNFLHTIFPVKHYTAFEILIPRGLVSASLSGSFESFTYTAKHRQPADVAILLLDDIQFNDFVHRDAGSAVYSIEPCSRQSLNWLLNSEYHKTKKYYFVFWNPDKKTHSPLVKADFTVRFN